MQTPLPRSIAIIGGGPSALFLYKTLLTSAIKHAAIYIFEARQHLGEGMPYSSQGANMEHVTNVSGNEIPTLVTPIIDWIRTLPKVTLDRYGIAIDQLSEYKVFPRLLFGEYLNAQFNLLQQQAAKAGIATHVYLNTTVTAITDVADSDSILVETTNRNIYEFDAVVICTGHSWPQVHEGEVPGYFDSPYPPAKLLQVKGNHAIALRGSSLTAVDAVRTLARNHGRFIQTGTGLKYELNDGATGFKMLLHTRHGLLPAVRFHLEDPHLSKAGLLTKAQVDQHRKENDGFLSLDYIFEQDFKAVLKKKDPALYDNIRHQGIEQFVETMLNMRERLPPFSFLKAEYEEAEQSIRDKRSVYWKELLATLSFALNYPAKHLSAEDMLRLQKVLMPLIAVVIAFLPQRPAQELMALHEAGLLEIVAAGEDSKVTIDAEKNIHYVYTDAEGRQQDTIYPTFIDCTGQRHLSIADFPFKGLVKSGAVQPARLPFRSAANALQLLEKGTAHIEAGSNGAYYLKVPGLAITDNFRAVSSNDRLNARIYIMAVPYIGGYNPDYSGLDFCEAASKLIVEDMENHKPAG